MPAQVVLRRSPGPTRRAAERTPGVGHQPDVARYRPPQQQTLDHVRSVGQCASQLLTNEEAPGGCVWCEIGESFCGRYA